MTLQQALLLAHGFCWLLLGMPSVLQAASARDLPLASVLQPIAEALSFRKFYSGRGGTGGKGVGCCAVPTIPWIIVSEPVSDAE